MDHSMTHFFCDIHNRHSFVTHSYNLAHDSTHSSSFFLIYPNIHTMSLRTSFIVIYFYSYDSFSCVASSFFPWLHYCAYWGCASWRIPDSFLTHIILHAGGIFQQQCHNHIICLVVESALHVYKGQFSPWLGQFRHYWNSHITGILIQQNSSTELQALYSLNTQPPDLECQKLSDLVSNLHHHCIYH